MVDPVQTLLAKKAQSWLQLRPGTDLALALAMIHVIIDQKLYDRKFVEHFTVGFNRLKDHVSKYSPAKVSKITWLAPEKIKDGDWVYIETKRGRVKQKAFFCEQSESKGDLCGFRLVVSRRRKL